jgi:hypothetical protein
MYKLLEPSGYSKFKIVYLLIQTFGTIWLFKSQDSLHSNLLETYVCPNLWNPLVIQNSR